VRICSLLAGAVLLAACRKGGEPEDQPSAVPVRVAQVARGDIARIVDLAGTLEPPPGFDVKLAPTVAGRLGQVLVADGDQVRAGQALARLDAIPLRDAVQQAEAQLSQARAQASNAATKLSRARQAVTAGVAPQQEADDAALQDQSARAAVRTAQAAVSIARNQLARSELKAPFDGVVVRVAAAAGELVDPSKMVIEVARIESLELRAPVAPSQATLLRAGQPATVETEAQPGVRFPGQVVAVTSVVDPATGSALVRIRVPNEKRVLRANVAGRCRVVVDVHKGALVVPRDAIVGGPDGPGVELVEQDKAKRVPVTLGYEDGERVEVLTGPSENQPIIVQGAYAIPDGTPVAPQREKADASPPETRPPKGKP
jgi:membrane fusion protein (multidrug efflux system)